MVDPRWADTEVQWLETARQSRCLAVVSDIINTHTVGAVRVRQNVAISDFLRDQLQ